MPLPALAILTGSRHLDPLPACCRLPASCNGPRHSRCLWALLTIYFNASERIHDYLLAGNFVERLDMMARLAGIAFVIATMTRWPRPVTPPRRTSQTPALVLVGTVTAALAVSSVGREGLQPHDPGIMRAMATTPVVIRLP
jgi:hypothetical protein